MLVIKVFNKFDCVTFSGSNTVKMSLTYLLKSVWNSLMVNAKLIPYLLELDEPMLVLETAKESFESLSRLKNQSNMILPRA